MKAWSESLKCNWFGWRVVGENELAVDLPRHNCTDMRGCIKVATALMPDVVRIQTIAGGIPDTEYRKVNGKWLAKL